MAVLKSRPRISLYLPPALVPGKRAVASVVLDARRPVPVEFIEAELTGTVQTVIRYGNSSISETRPLVTLRARLADEREIPAGRTRLDFHFDLPKGLPVSYRGACAFVTYVMTVHAAIPWWPDAKKRFALVVADPNAEPDRAVTPALVSSAPEGPHGTEPHAELSLADTAVVAGGVISGAVALRNVAFARYVGIDVALVAVEQARARSSRTTRESARYAFHLPVEHPEEAAPVPFRLRVPKDVPPTLRHDLFDLDWFVEVRAKRRFAFDLVFLAPVHVFPAPTEDRPVRSERAPPVIGSDRVAAIWNGVAQTEGLVFEDEEIKGHVGGVGLRVFREHRGSKGIFLFAELVFPSLELGLDGGATTGFRRVFGNHGVELGNAEWDAHHYLIGRHREQVEAFARVIGPALCLGRVDDLEDARILLVRESAGLSAEPVRELTRAALAIARLIEPARAAIPPPSGFDYASWYALAQTLGGTLENARMVVKGELDGEPIEIATRWSEALALETRISVSPRHGLDTRAAHGLELKSARALEISEKEIVASLSAPIADANEIARILPDLSRLLEQTRASRAAYR